MFEKYLEELKSKGLYRKMRSIDGRDDFMVSVDGVSMVNLSSNDYLGIAANNDFQKEFYSQMNDSNMFNYSLGSTSSRLITGNNFIYDKLEEALASKIGKEAALVFNSGYHTNIGVLSAITDKNDLILSDKLNHASIIDGLKLSDADVKRYKHLSYSHLEDLLTRYRKEYNRVVIVTESLFSMDGDIADLKRIVEIKNRFDCLLYVDEAHSFGCYGDSGMGLCQREKVIDDIDIVVGTFGKAFASHGAFAALSNELKEVLVNKMRSLIFTTALPPVNILWNLFILDKVDGFTKQRANLESISNKLRDSLIENGIETRGESYIVPAMTMDNAATLKISQDLQNQGFLISAIRPPTVPPNTSRLRISLTANLRWEQLQSIAPMIANLRK